MVRGRPDYLVATGGLTPEKLIAYSQVQVPVAMFDDFESTTLKWVNSMGSVALDSTAASGGYGSPVVNGNSCLKITSTSGGSAQASRFGALPEYLNSVGFSYYFWSKEFGDMKAQDRGISFFDCDLYTGDKHKNFHIWYNPSTYDWFYDNTSGDTLTLLTNREMNSGSNHYIKLVVDFIEDVALYVIIDGEKFWLSNISLFVEDVVQVAYLESKILFYAAAAKTPSLYIDDYKVTYNEP